MCERELIYMVSLRASKEVVTRLLRISQSFLSSFIYFFVLSPATGTDFCNTSNGKIKLQSYEKIRTEFVLLINKISF